MTSQNDEPVTTPDQSATPPGVLPGGAPTPPPGMLTNDAVPAPAPGPPVGPGFSWTPSRPTGLATTTIVLTGVVALLGLVGAVLAQSIVDSLKESIGADSMSQFSPTQLALTSVSSLATIGSFIALALWMGQIRRNVAALGSPAGGPAAVEWWGWFVPVAWFVLPYLGMRAITRRARVSAGLLLGWWLPFCAYWIAFWVGQVVPITAVDYSTGEVTDPDAFDVLVPISWVSGITLAIAWVFLATIVRQTTRRHLD